MQIIQYQVTAEFNNLRLDLFIKAQLSNNSRTQIQQNIKNNLVSVNDSIINQPKFIVSTNDIISYPVITHNTDNYSWEPNKIDLDIIFEDEYLLVINKPVNLSMHPGAGNPNNTIANAILNYIPNNQELPRAGIVHRLDKNTSGCCVIAKTINSHHNLTKMLQDRTVKRTYLALVYGKIELPGTIIANIGRHNKNRVLMAVTPTGKSAITHYKPIIQYDDHTLLEVQLETGRTHQIRVHLSYNKNPIVGDKQYANYKMPDKNYPDTAKSLLSQYPQQALHAIQLQFNHPELLTQTITVQARPPKVFIELLQALKSNIIYKTQHSWQQLLK